MSCVYCLKLGYSQNHLAVAGGYVVDVLGSKGCAPTRYREVVLTVSNSAKLESLLEFLVLEKHAGVALLEKDESYLLDLPVSG
jgi:hypothetical protein